MSFARAGRAWMRSVLTCVGLLAAWVAAAGMATGRTGPIWHNIADISLVFGSAYAITAALLFVPVFSVLAAVSGQFLTRIRAAIAGAALGPVALFAIALIFREAEAPLTPPAWLLYWVMNLGETAIASLPFVGAGGVFGWSWVGNDNRLLAYPVRPA